VETAPDDGQNPNQKEGIAMTNQQFSEQDPTFKKACELTKWTNQATGKVESLRPTKRQASKWRNGKGLAKRMHGTAASVLKRCAR